MTNAFSMPQQQREQFPQMREGDDKLFRQFYMGSIQNAEKSAEAGHPVFDAVPFIKIIVPGDKNTVIDTTANDEYKRRFAREWAQFMANEDQQMSGLPVREWPGVTRAQAEELMHMNIVTVEQLASLPDVYGGKIMGFQGLKRKAETYLAAAKDTALTEKLSAENAALKTRIEGQEAELKRLSEAFEDMRRGNNGNNRSGTDPNRSK